MGLELGLELGLGLGLGLGVGVGAGVGVGLGLVEQHRTFMSRRGPAHERLGGRTSITAPVVVEWITSWLREVVSSGLDGRPVALWGCGRR